MKSTRASFVMFSRFFFKSFDVFITFFTQNHNDSFRTIVNIIFENFSHDCDIFNVCFNILMIQFVKCDEKLTNNKNLIVFVENIVVTKYEIVFDNSKNLLKNITIHAYKFAKTFFVIKKKIFDVQLNFETFTRKFKYRVFLKFLYKTNHFNV